MHLGWRPLGSAGALASLHQFLVPICCSPPTHQEGGYGQQGGEGRRRAVGISQGAEDPILSCGSRIKMQHNLYRLYHPPVLATAHVRHCLSYCVLLTCPGMCY